MSTTDSSEMDEKISKLFLPLLEKLYQNEPAGEPFRQPVDIIKYGCYDYYHYVKHPIDLSTIRQRLLSRQYQQDAWRFVADIQLMFANAYLFNKKGTPVYDFTNRLSKIWYSDLAPIMQRLNYCCGTLHKFGPQLLFCHGTTPDRYCQIPIGAKYKCYKDQYSYCIQCFNQIDSEYINIQDLSCETSRMNLPTQPVKRSDFIDCTNDNWQYESFIQCTQCSRRLHQICELYPAEQQELEKTLQHSQIEHEQKSLCQVPEEYRIDDEGTKKEKEKDGIEFIVAQYDDDDHVRPLLNSSSQNILHSSSSQASSSSSMVGLTPSVVPSTSAAPRIESPFLSASSSLADLTKLDIKKEVDVKVKSNNDHENLNGSQQQQTNTSLDDELMQFARDVDDLELAMSAPSSPSPDENFRFDSAKESFHRKPYDRSSNRVINSNSDTKYNTSNELHENINYNINKKCSIFSSLSSNHTSNVTNSNQHRTSSAKNSVDSIATRLSINKMAAEVQTDEPNYLNNSGSGSHQTRDKFVCNHCYRQKKIGFNIRHRKYSARRLPHTRMSRYIETKVNEYIRDNSPTAGEVTIRVLTAYRDTVTVKPEMRNYVKRVREQDPHSHPNLRDYPDEFSYTNRAIFAWQEIDGVDVCVFGMHVQEYDDDCPEPNKQVIYLSYLDSVHFFRPKQVRTAVYHEILLSYFRYVKKLGFRRVFIWVCPSRKGDDYIFYRHPSEQKMPTLKRLADWYVNLLDKGAVAGIVEKHQNIFQFASDEKLTSILSMPYLSGDYWPGEFERLLKIMIESQKIYETRSDHEQDQGQLSEHQPIDGGNQSAQDFGDRLDVTTSGVQQLPDTKFISTFPKIYHHHTDTSLGLDLKTSIMNTFAPFASTSRINCFSTGEDFGSLGFINDCKHQSALTPDSIRSNLDQPLDLSKSSSNTSPRSHNEDDGFSEAIQKSDNRKKRRKPNDFGYTKKRTKSSSTQSTSGSRSVRRNPTSLPLDISTRFLSQPTKQVKTKSSTNFNRESLSHETLLTPEEEMMKNLEKSLKRQKDGFIVVRLNECDCSPHFENQRRREEAIFSCELMKGREPFLQLARLKNYEFSSLRRAKFSSLAMVKHLSQYFTLDPICNECFSFDSSKRYYACSRCEDLYLCTSCHENTHHDHIMSIMAPSTLPDIDEFLQQCSLPSTTNSISSASSTISNKSFNESALEMSTNPAASSSPVQTNPASTLLNRQLSNALTTAKAHKTGRSRASKLLDHFKLKTEDEENAAICPLGSSSKLILPNQTAQPQTSHSDSAEPFCIELDEVLINNFVRHAEVSYDIDFDQMKGESKRLLSHYYSCPLKEACHKCKFVVLSCSFVGALARSPRMQLVMDYDRGEITSGTNSHTNHTGGINLTPAHRLTYQPKDK